MAGVENHLRRTPLRSALDRYDVDWTAIGDAAVVAKARSSADPRALAIADLSPLPRIGFKGRETVPAMQKRGIALEATANRAFRQADGSLCLVLAASEIVMLGPLSGDNTAIEKLIGSWSIDDGERTFPVLRRDGNAWFAISGHKAPQLFAKICGVDVRTTRFVDLSIAQTSIAKLNAILARSDVGSTPVYHLLADSASGLYLFECLMDAASEFGGGICGLNSIRELETS
ncbi:MAG: hypothetical protein NW216_01885 [Hyphomicrobium sp.]|nr:hypothetical protein [Hyphomicrobium sp.]